MFRSLLGGAALCAAGLTAAPASADFFAATRSNRLVEHRHDVSVTLHRDHAELVAVRTVFNGGPRHDQATFFLDLPAGGVATGLRTEAMLNRRLHWYDGELMEAGAAAAKYRELTGIGGYYPKDPALLSWRWQGRLALQVFPCPPGQNKRVEYTVKLPTRYEDGAYRVTLPWLGTEQVAAQFRVQPPSAGDRVLVDGQPLPASGRITVPRDDEVTLALVPAAQPRLGGTLAVVPFAPNRVLTHLRFEAARELSTVPVGAHIVVVVDGSISFPNHARQAAGATLSAYLSHFLDARVELVTFDRRVHYRYGHFVPVAEVRADLEQLDHPGANGSAIDDALLAADRLLAHAPAGAARRIVAVTDGRTRAGLTPERLRAAVATSGAIVHIGMFHTGWPSLERDDEHPWAAAIHTTGGLVWNAVGTGEAEDAATQRHVYEEWARPLRLDHPKTFSPDLALDVTRGDDPLDEGQAICFSSVVDRPLRWVRLEGELWATRVHHVLVPSAQQEKLWAALVFGTDHLDELSEPEMMTLAIRGGAVSPVTSYLAIEPGVRPSTDGLEWGGVGTGMGFGSGHGRLGGSHAVKGPRQSLDREAWLRDELGRAWQRCGGKPNTATVDFETTVQEVVAVGTISQIAPDPILSRCLAEAVWALTLPSDFREPWNVWSVAV